MSVVKKEKICTLTDNYFQVGQLISFLEDTTGEGYQKLKIYLLPDTDFFIFPDENHSDRLKIVTREKKTYKDKESGKPKNATYRVGQITNRFDSSGKYQRFELSMFPNTVFYILPEATETD